jgi:4-amino-4-deoxy-L-arabinose transferase-like glycosyltransferase
MAGGRTLRSRLFILLAVLLAGLVLFVLQLGATGLVDETPPLFAASARAMAETGDWLVPRVNGLPRYDKPPLVYWLMGALYALPGQARWDPLGSWAAALPSALAMVALMLLLADTLWRWPQAPPASPGPAGTPGAPLPELSPIPSWSPALATALALALSPLVLLWGRIGVSDALFTATLAGALLLFWRSYAAPDGRWWLPWGLLALAVLTKGPVAVLLAALVMLAFAWCQADAPALARRLRPLPGLALLAGLALPWYGLVLLREGHPFWDSFFGYHNLQRFTSVVNHHLQPWWFFLPVLVVASLPATPLLLLGLVRALTPLDPSCRRPRLPHDSLALFAACWLLVVLAFFTLAATKLPSYWLPATPAAAVLIVQATAAAAPFRPQAAGPVAPDSAADADSADPALRRAWRLTLLLTVVLGAAYLAGPLWVPLIQDPELPTLAAGILASRLLPLAGGCYLLAAALGWLLRRRPWPQPLLALQLPLVAFVPLALLPLWGLGDQLRGAPVRAMAAAVRSQARPGEPLAMVGILKPSLHFYSRRVVLYEGIPPVGPLNLADRLRRESRPGQPPSRPEQQPTVLVVIDRTTAGQPHWQGLAPIELARSGLYRLWRLDRGRLEQRARELANSGLRSDWWRPRPERY